MILVTGGGGFLGTHVTQALRDFGEEVVIARRQGPTPVDVTDLASVLALGSRYPITRVVHLAAAGLTEGSTLDKLWADTLGLFSVLRAAYEWNVERVLLASSIGVYAGVTPDDGFYHEDARLPVASPHAIPAVKKIAETVAAAQREVPAVTARIGAIWGPRGRSASPFFAAPGLIHQVVRGEQPTAAADDAIDMLYAKDCGAAVAHLATSSRLRHSAYNIGSGRVTSNRELAGAIERVVPGARIALTDGGEAQAALDVTRLSADTEFVPAYALDRAVADYTAWLAVHER
ncbi:MAG: NAD(P)-dependent oxidoreductase [Hamadaea sp.]|uniref:NAD-dependent epimerase/dehydratase family protein n=1 Tax=Hamadaea sp. TaxID=2024425 RepID=UPI0017D2FC78|nr:NAD(P)-dependent oxidoreductase [Hamadaea sp.]NUR71025.1 NAD(P)-dependent oxidoreductase [Hamadaea sp.]NUT23706.1 NAD(P)-dependent oxidoreductase [Hamadaea sp.]